MTTINQEIKIEDRVFTLRFIHTGEEVNDPAWVNARKRIIDSISEIRLPSEMLYAIDRKTIPISIDIVEDDTVVYWLSGLYNRNFILNKQDSRRNALQLAELMLSVACWAISRKQQ